MKSIILLHGAIGAEDQLQALANTLTSRQAEVYSFSFSGHGKNPFRDSFGIDAFASELEQFIKDHQLNQPDVFGYSMGGYVALYLAKKHPGLLGKIITLGTKFAWSPDIAAREVKMLDATTIKEKVPKFAAALEARHGAEWQTLLQRTAAMMTALGADPALKENDLSSIENKVLIGLADHDSMVSLDETLAAYRQLRQADMYMLPATKHPIETVNAGLLAEIISAYLAGA